MTFSLEIGMVKFSKLNGFIFHFRSKILLLLVMSRTKNNTSVANDYPIAAYFAA